MLNFDQAPIGGFLKEKLKDYQPAPVTYEYGTVESCQDGIVRVSGLSHAQYGELLEFENDAYGMLFFLGRGKDAVGFAGTALEMAQLVLVIGSIIPVERALKRNFDDSGIPRPDAPDL